MASEYLKELLSKIEPEYVEPFKGKTVLVTGATGFVGSVFIKALLVANERLDNQTIIVAAVRDVCKAKIIFDGFDSSQLTYYEVGNFSQPQEFAIENVDYILHGAAITQSKLMIERPTEVINAAYTGTREMLELSMKRAASMIYLSSMEYYGTLPEGVIATEDKLGYIDLSKPRTSYPESKRMCECLCNVYASQYDVQACSARLANSFGAGILPSEGRAFMQFAKSALAGKNIVLKTKGLSENNHVNVIDAVRALMFLLTKGVPGEAYNVSNEASHGTIREMAELAANTLGDGSSKVVIDFDEDNSAGYAPDVHLKMSSAKLETLGWKPKYEIKDSFEQLAAYIKEQGLI